MTPSLPGEHRYAHRCQPTPLVPVQMEAGRPLVWCKLEFLNPSGSTKDRIARHILEKAWRRGQLRTGSLVVEASSGSTSIALALACAQMGLHFRAVMPEGVSSERVMIIRAYGGEVLLTPQAEGIRGAMAATAELAAREGAYLPRQFENPDNAEAHRVGTAREIADQVPGGVAHAIVSGVGTGGTLVGIWQGLDECGCPVLPVLARPVSLRGVLEAEGCSFSTRIPGVADSLSTIFRDARLPGMEVVEIADDLALETARRLIRLGFPVGPSSGLNYAASEIIASRLGPQARVATVFPDRMERYFTTELFRDSRET